MPGSFFGIHIASQALRAFEAALNVTGHNLANVNTRGYSRQLVNIQQTPSVTFFALRRTTMGAGAAVQSINRVRDMFLQGRFLQSSFEGARLNQMLDTLRGVEDIFAEPGANGIANAMSAMFNAWSQLSANPADEGARLNLRLNAETFVGRVRDAHKQMIGFESRLGEETVATIEEINRLGQRISDLNGEIRRESALGAQPNDLMDQRDLLIEDLSKLVDIRTQQLPDGAVTVFINQHTLVDQLAFRPLPLTYDAASSSIISGTLFIKIKGGRLAGLLGGLNAIDTYQAQLDTLITEVRDQVNALHRSGINLNGTTNIDFFTGALGPADFDLSAEVKADLRNIAAGTSGAPGDGGLAMAIAGLQDTRMPGLGNRTPAEFYGNLIGRLGEDASFFAGAAETQEALLSQLEQQRQAISGVNVDEEVATMLRYQRSFQAAAKVLSVLDQTTEELIKMIR